MAHRITTTGGRALATVLLAGLLALPAIAQTTGPAAAQRATAATATAVIQNFAFAPASLTIAVGDTVIWTQKDSIGHTVTSDNNTWPESPLLKQGETFKYTFTKAGTYTYHCRPHPNMTGTIIVVASASGGSKDSGGKDDKSGKGGGHHDDMGGMGAKGMANMTTWTGWYDNKKVRYLSTDTSSKSEAARDHINYAPGLAKLTAGAGLIYLVANGKFANNGPVFNSVPGDASYSPLWQEAMVTWTNPAEAVALGTDEQINNLVKAGKLTVRKTGVVLNCPIITGMVAGHM